MKDTKSIIREEMFETLNRKVTHSLEDRLEETLEDGDFILSVPVKVSLRSEGGQVVVDKSTIPNFNQEIKYQSNVESLASNLTTSMVGACNWNKLCVACDHMEICKWQFDKTHKAPKDWSKEDQKFVENKIIARF